MKFLVRRRTALIWQFSFLILSTTWLLAPIINNHLSGRVSLISQYETPFEPYSWLFRTGDVLGGLLVIGAAWGLLKKYSDRLSGWLLLIVGAGLFLDPLLSTTCHLYGNHCVEYSSPKFIAHAIETVMTSAAIFTVATYDVWRRKKVVSISFGLFQLAYGLLFVSQLASQDRFNTLSQYIYQTVVILWLAWFVRDLLWARTFEVKRLEQSVVRIATAVWAFVNGLAAIVLSLAHIHLLGRIRGLYFAGDSAWLAQHGVIVGVLLLYISRHLARGEVRARQIFLAVAGTEALKYSVVSPNFWLTILYLVTFCVLFVMKDDFDRGVIPLTWRLRFKELYFMLGALGLASAIALLMLDRDNRVALITGRAFGNFFDYVSSKGVIIHSHLPSVLLANTISAFLLSAGAILLWIIFKPTPGGLSQQRDTKQILRLLEACSKSTEDYFKLWPADKNYFWSQTGDGFIAYKRIGGTVYGLADPICANPSELLHDFLNWAKARRLKVGFFPVYRSSKKLYQSAGLELIQIGSSAVVDTGAFISATAKDKWWRWQKNRASKAGYQFQISEPPHAQPLLTEFRKVSDAWLTKAGRKEHGFATGYFDETYLNQSSVYYLADSRGRVVAFTNIMPTFTKSNTATVDMLRHLPDIDNAMPYLLYKTVEKTSEDNYRYFDLGFVPFAKAEGPLLTAARAISGSKFSSFGLEQFKNKFDPDWQPNYLAYDGDIADLAVIALGIEKAMEKN